MIVRPSLVSYSYQNDWSTRERSPAISRMATVFSKVLLPLFKSKVLPILRDAAESCPEQQSKMVSGAFLRCLSSKKGRSSFETIGGRKTLVPSEGRRIFPDMKLIIQLERKRFDDFDCTSNIANAQRKNDTEFHGKLTPVYFSCCGTSVKGGETENAGRRFSASFPCSAFARTEKWVPVRLLYETKHPLFLKPNLWLF